MSGAGVDFYVWRKGGRRAGGIVVCKTDEYSDSHRKQGDVCSNVAINFNSLKLVVKQYP